MSFHHPLKLDWLGVSSDLRLREQQAVKTFNPHLLCFFFFPAFYPSCLFITRVFFLSLKQTKLAVIFLSFCRFSCWQQLFIPWVETAEVEIILSHSETLEADTPEGTFPQLVGFAPFHLHSWRVTEWTFWLPHSKQTNQVLFTASWAS